MGAIADAMSRFAQPLIEATDGSPEQLQKALMLSQLCWNMALTPEEERDDLLADMQPIMKLDDGEFQEFKRTVVMPMIRRHQELFPAMRHPGAMNRSRAVPSHATPPLAPNRPIKKYPGTGRNATCPCGSGKKYKVCCGR